MQRHTPLFSKGRIKTKTNIPSKINKLQLSELHEIIKAN